MEDAAMDVQHIKKKDAACTVACSATRSEGRIGAVDGAIGLCKSTPIGIKH